MPEDRPENFWEKPLSRRELVEKAAGTVGAIKAGELIKTAAAVGTGILLTARGVGLLLGEERRRAPDSPMGEPVAEDKGKTFKIVVAANEANLRSKPEYNPDNPDQYLVGKALKGKIFTGAKRVWGSWINGAEKSRTIDLSAWGDRAGKEMPQSDWFEVQIKVPDEKGKKVTKTVYISSSVVDASLEETRTK
ncbi:MAG: hypothetical protein ACOZBZ_03750 [Patescibacteria group bacterium]